MCMKMKAVKGESENNSFLGHIMRHTGNEQLQLILEYKVDGKQNVSVKKKLLLKNKKTDCVR